MKRSVKLMGLPRRLGFEMDSLMAILTGLPRRLEIGLVTLMDFLKG